MDSATSRCVHIGLFNFENVDVDGFLSNQLVQLVFKLFNACALGADEHTGLGSVDIDDDLILAAFDSDGSDTVGIILLFDVVS